MSSLQSENNELVPNAAEVEAVLAIIEEATKAKRPLAPMSKTEQALHKIQEWFMSHAVAAALIMLFTAMLAVYTQSVPAFVNVVVASPQAARFNSSGRIRSGFNQT
jgi:hypothetical protein